MSFYRRITRERTLSSFNDLNTTDVGLKESIASFSRTPREAKFYDTFKIQEDYYSRKGVNCKGKCELSLSDADDSDYDDRRYSWESTELTDLNNKKHKERKSFSKKLKEKIPMKWFRKRTTSSDTYISEAKSSYGTDKSCYGTDKSSYGTDKSSCGTDMSYSDLRSEFSKSEKMDDGDRESVYERSVDTRTINTRFNMRSKRGRKEYH